MNKLTLTSEGFYDYANDLLSPQQNVIAALGHGRQVSPTFMHTLESVIEIMSQKPTKFLYQLEFPERHYPLNASQTFWTRVWDLMKTKGVTFEVKTSDPIALGFVDRTRTREGVVTKGWDEITVITRYADGVESYSPKYGFGKNLSDLFTGNY